MDLKVKEVMSEDVITAHWTEELGSAYNKMTRLGIRHLPVVDDHGDLIGIISDRDFQRAMITDVSYSSTAFAKAEFEADSLVRDFMSQPVMSVDVKENIKSVVHLMIDKKISAILVVDSHNKLAGIVTSEDLLRVLADILDSQPQSVLEEVERYTYNSPIGAVATALSQVGV